MLFVHDDKQGTMKELRMVKKWWSMGEGGGGWWKMGEDGGGW